VKTLTTVEAVKRFSREAYRHLRRYQDASDSSIIPRLGEAREASRWWRLGTFKTSREHKKTNPR